MFLPAKHFDFLPGTRQKMMILSSGAAPLVFSYLRSRSFFVFAFGEIPMFLAAKTNRFFAGYPAKNADIPMFLPAEHFDFLPGTRQKMPILSSGAAPFVFSYLRNRSSFVFIFCEIPMFLPAQQIDFLSGTRQKMPILSSEAVPLVFSYLKSRSSFVFLFGEIPIFLLGTREKIKIFCRVRVKKMPISSPGAGSFVFSYLRSCSSCVFLFGGKKFNFAAGAAPLVFS